MKVQTSIEIQFYSKKNRKPFAKTVRSINTNKTYSEIFVGEFLSEGEHFIESETIILRVENQGNSRYPKKFAYIGVVDKNGEIQWQNENNGYGYPGRIVTIANHCQQLLDNQKQNK